MENEKQENSEKVLLPRDVARSLTALYLEVEPSIANHVRQTVEKGFSELQKENEQIKEVVLFGLSLIALAEQFDVDLGKGWQNFREMAKTAGIEYQFTSEKV